MRESLSVAPVGEKLLIISTNGDRSKVDKTSIRRWKSGPISFYEKENQTELKNWLINTVNNNVTPNMEDSNIMCLVHFYF